ncbi:FG-GAP-like repeat-containing protein [Xanthomarina spongicola]|uniref:Putative secreted protein (Por secretion system target) n=1 Tax=Xanthomarina spongicola TaxID=570520 RepID=A0A316DQY7_9FLAO|nr:FG-GAP-like repeat-containing protein [Xanthomarina spongicola]PWK20434.1 putative secreted protein (Por secretion system target) [Xanthomarina spongicola]
MKKTILLITLLLSGFCSIAQVLNQNANWPNSNWDLAGSFDSDPLIFTGNPTTDSANFSFDDDQGGGGSINNIAVQSPVINLTNAYNAGETTINITSTYVLNVYQTETITLQYWDADANTWNNWGSAYGTDTTNPPNVDFCAGTFDPFNSTQLNISSFTSTQLTGFRYRIHYNDNGSFGWGMCYASPTITSSNPPDCLVVSNLNVTSITDNSANISWQPGQGETSWQIVVQLSGATPPTSGISTNLNNPYPASGLNADTNYKAYIRANCVSDGYSEWVSIDFRTLEPPPNPGDFVFIRDNSISMSGTSYAVVDMNNDGLDDLIAASSSNLNINYQTVGGFSYTNYSAPTNYGPTWSMAAGDIDGNGYNDLLYAAGNGVSFLKANNDGTAYSQSDVTTAYVFSQRSNFVDIDNDGHLDAFVCHDVQPNVYFINNGSGLDGSLAYYQGPSAAVPNGLGTHPNGGNYGTVWIDYDNDRDIDMFIAKCRGGNVTHKINELWRNDRNGNFVNVATAAGLADPVQTWSSAWADFDNDGDMDVYVGASSGSDGAHKYMINNGDGTFTDATATANVGSAPYGIENAPGDFNNDGYVDILSNGRILLNNGDNSFTVISTDMPPSGAIGDIDGDGFLDVFNGNLYKNNGGNGNNYIKIITIGVQSNYNGIGARIEIHTDSGTQIRDVRSGEGFEYMSSLTAHFGLGTDTVINNMVIYWPSGVIDNILNPDINMLHSVVEGQSLTIVDETLTDLVMYPNPTENLLYFESTADISNKVATIFDITGKKIFSSKLLNKSLDVSQLNSGIYIIRLEEKGKVINRKFVKK